MKSINSLDLRNLVCAVCTVRAVWAVSVTLDIKYRYNNSREYDEQPLEGIHYYCRDDHPHDTLADILSMVE